jgi:hypothetical protein
MPTSCCSSKQRTCNLTDLGELLTVLSNHTTFNLEGLEALKPTANSKFTHFQGHFHSSIDGLLTLDYDVHVYVAGKVSQLLQLGRNPSPGNGVSLTFFSITV